MIDNNTIFYGHNLLNHTAFGSLSKVFSSKKEDIKIIILDKDLNTIYSNYERHFSDTKNQHQYLFCQENRSVQKNN